MGALYEICLYHCWKINELTVYLVLYPGVVCKEEPKQEGARGRVTYIYAHIHKNKRNKS